MKTQHKIYLIIFCFIFTVINSYSQEYAGIKGIVRDSATGEKIPFAVIQIAGQNLGINANSNGVFVLKGIHIGTRTVHISAIGYQKATKQITLKEGDFLSLPVSLSPEPVELSSVTSESYRTSSTSLANISVQSIDQREIKSIPTAVEKDVMKTLKALPGVSSSSDVTGQLFIRGGASDQNIVLCDFLKVSNPFHAMGLFGIFNNDIVKSSDVITGGFDPEYGGRLSSVIKINTRDGNKNENKIKLNAGLLSGSATVEGPALWGSYLLSYRRSYLDDIVHKMLGQDVSLSFSDFFGKYSLAFGNEGNVSVNVLTSSDDVDRLKNADPSYQWRNMAVGVNIQSFLSNVYVSWTTSYSRYKIEENFLSPSYGTNSNSSFSSLSLNGKVDYQFTNNDVLSIGLDMDVFTVKNSFTNSYGYNLKTSDNVPVASFYMKYQLAFIKNLLLDAGFRQNRVGFDNQSLSLFEPRFNLRYNLTGDIAVKASVTRMHQFIISNVNEDELIPLYEAWICLKDPKDGLGHSFGYPLYPERADQIVFGLDTRLFGKYKFVVQGYYKEIKDYIGYNMYRQDDSDYEFITGSGTAKGIELYFKFDYRNFFGWLTYNLAWTEKENGGIKYSPRYDKRHNLSIIAGYTLPYDIKFGGSWDFSTGTPFTPITNSFEQPNPHNIFDNPIISSSVFYSETGSKYSRRLPFYHKLDINLSREFKFASLPKTEISMNVSNIYNRKNIFYFNRRTGERKNMLPFMVTGSISMEI